MELIIIFYNEVKNQKVLIKKKHIVIVWFM
jgi:hypothetical protein